MTMQEIEKSIMETRDCLVSLLIDMTNEPPRPVILTELDTFSKVGLLTTCCAEMIVMALRATATDRADAMQGLDLLVADMRRQMSGKSQSPLN